jgi:TonB family protein
MKWLIALALLWPMATFAQTQQSIPTASKIASPSATGTSHACGVQWYPPAAVANNEQGTVGLALQIDAGGNTKNIHVTATSGYADLDEAAVACAATWKYHPATQDGHPVEVPWRANVKWAMDYINVPTPAGQIPHACESTGFPREVIRSGIGGDVRVLFQISTDGSVKNATITRSSGDQNLDQLTIDCVSKWKYMPVVIDGKPVEIPWQTAVNWQVGEKPAGITLPVAAGSPHTCANAPNSDHAPNATLLRFAVEPDGSVMNAEIEKSSGDAEVDKYALACVSQWQYRPAMREGRPVEARLGARLVWNATTPTHAPISPPTPADAKPINCSEALRKRDLPANLGATELSFDVDADGSVKDVAVTKSSGSQDVDLSAGTCAYSWRYNPAMQDGKPVKVHWHETVTWNPK